MTGMELFMCPAGVEALRTFASKINATTNNMGNDILNLLNIYESLKEDVGPHAGQFKEMLEAMSGILGDSRETLEILASRINATAQGIENYLNSQAGGDQKVHRLR